jgi:hypothetical protein
MQRYYDKHKYCRKCEIWRDKALRRCDICHTLLRTKSHNNPYRHFVDHPSGDQEDLQRVRVQEKQDL